MRRRVGTVLISSFGLLAIILLAILLFVRWSLPAVSGKVTLPGLNSDVRVLRDQWGIPHIYAADELDAFRALGFVAAQDRLFQMDIYRRLANGQLSEVFGNGTIQIDELARTLGFRYYAEKLLASNAMSPEVLRAAAAYRDGVNFYVETQRLPVEFEILGYKPRKFEIAEMLAFEGYLAYSFSEAFRGDILYSELLNDIAPEKVNELRGGVEDSAPSIAKGVKVGINRHLFAMLHSDELLQGFGGFNGSNSWVASPVRSKSGRAMLANDPHIAFSKPAVWYEAHLISPTLEIYGHFASLLPFPVLGHRRDIAWAMTMSEIDDMDFYREKANPEHPDAILYKNQWVKLDTRAENIAVKGGKDITLKIQTGPHGPLVQHLFSGTTGQLISMKWQQNEPGNLALETLFGLAHAKTMDEFAAAIKKAKAPGLNISYADKAGNIAWWVMGQIPIRPPNSQPDMVMDGASGA